MNQFVLNFKYFIFERMESLLSCVVTRARQQLRQAALVRNLTAFTLLSQYDLWHTNVIGYFKKGITGVQNLIYSKLIHSRL